MNGASLSTQGKDGYSRGSNSRKSMMPADNVKFFWHRLEEAVAEDWWKMRQVRRSQSQKASNDTRTSLDLILSALQRH